MRGACGRGSTNKHAETEVRRHDGTRSQTAIGRALLGSIVPLHYGKAPLGRFLCIIFNRQGHGFTYLDTTQFHDFATDLSGKQAAFMARSHALDAGSIFKAVITTPAPQKTEPSTLIPSTELDLDRTCLTGLG